MRENEKAMLKEYKVLRQELLEIQKTRIWGVLAYLVVVSGVSALQSYFFTPFLYIFLIFAALPFLWYTANRERSRIRIASYIKTVIEPQVSGLGWEAHISEWRFIVPGKRKIQRIIDHWRYIFSLTGIYLLIVITCFSLLIISTSNISIKILGVFGVALILEAYVYLSIILYSSGEYEDVFREAFDRLSKSEKEQVSKVDKID